MGLDLRIHTAYLPGSDLSLDVISLHRESKIFDIVKSISDLVGRDVSFSGFNRFCDNGLERASQDAYGNTVKMVQAKDLKQLKDLTADYRNKAAFAYISELPDDLECFLYWH